MAVLSWASDLRRLLRWPARVFALAACVVPAVTGWSAETAVSSEYQLKAVFLFNFTQFVEWPRQAFADPNAPIVIGVLGVDPFGAYLDQTVQGEKINGRSLEVRRYRNVAEIDTCHVLFISQSETSRIKDTVARLRNRPILTVGDSDGFAVNGGIIRFITDKARIKLRVNLDSAKAAGLVISSKLLRAADIVASQKE
jgi:hypothetical protein